MFSSIFLPSMPTVSVLSPRGKRLPSKSNRATRVFRPATLLQSPDLPFPRGCAVLRLARSSVFPSALMVGALGFAMVFCVRASVPLHSPIVCPSVRIALVPAWRPPSTFKFSPFSSAPSSASFGSHATSSTHSLRAVFSSVCSVSFCSVCLQSVTGPVGFTPSVLSVRSDLRSKPCFVEHVLRHERLHAEVTSQAQVRVLDTLRRFFSRFDQIYPVRLFLPSDLDSEFERLRTLISGRADRALIFASAWAAKQNDLLDSPRSKRLASERMYSSCRSLP